MSNNAIRICGINLSGRAVLAPMAGAADSAFRLVARKYGAALVFTELVSSDGLIRDSRKTRKLMEFLPEESPIGIQLFGCHAETMADAAVSAQELQPDLIDLNFGCPSRKIVKRGMGAAVMKNIKNLEAIVSAVVRSVRTPVSVKLRSGWTFENINVVEAARAAEAAGARLITVHPRTQTQGFSGRADWQWITKVKQAVTVPVIGNGDVVTPADAKRMLDETGSDLVMVGRGALGRPWLFSQINRLLETGESTEEPPPEERIKACLIHFRKAVELSGEPKGVFEMRKHIGWYVKGLKGNAAFRRHVFSLTDRQSVEDALRFYEFPA
jgi:tRNA-dihydrouridine synthase B